MSIIAPAIRRNRWSYIALAAVAASAALAGALVLKERASDAGVGSSPEAVATVAAPGIEQASWKLSTFPAGTVGKPSKAELRSVASQRDAVVATIAEVYDALWLKPKALGSVAAKSFEAGAAKALTRARVGLPAGARDVQIVKRKAAIGIDAQGARTAAARVVVVATGDSKRGKWRIEHAANLWLQRSGSRWKVIAFDYRQAGR